MSISSTQNPWSNADASNIDTSQDSGWADFGNFASEFPSQSGNNNQNIQIKENFEKSSGEPSPDTKSPDHDKKSGDVEKGLETFETEEFETFECASEITPTNSPELVGIVDSTSQPCA